MERIALQVAVNAVALWIAVELVDGIHFLGEWWELLIVALGFALINTFVRPALRLVALPITLATLGIFLLVINAALLLLLGALAGQLGIAFVVADFLAAVLGAIIVSIVSLLMSMVLRTTRLARGRL